MYVTIIINEKEALTWRVGKWFGLSIHGRVGMRVPGSLWKEGGKRERDAILSLLKMYRK